MVAPDLDNPIPISALQHAVYCLRQAALIHIERAWAENRLTAEGRVLHEVAHEPGSRNKPQQHPLNFAGSCAALPYSLWPRLAL